MATHGPRGRLRRELDEPAGGGALPRPEGDDALAERAARGERAAFDALVRRHLRRVHGLLFRMVGNHEDAEDLAQDTFVKAHRGLALYRAEGSFESWLFRIALHLARDHFRRRGRRARETALAEDPGDAPADRPGRGPREEASRRELSARLAAGLERLPHRVHAAFVLRTFEGLDYLEIGRILGITDGTARVHVMKARRRLARWVGPWLGGERGLGERRP